MLFKTIKPLLCDGAIGTEILKQTDQKIPEILNLTNPELVKQIHLNYIKAGSDIITTNSFGANYPRLRSAIKNFEEINIYELNKLSAQIANKIKPKDKLLFGSVGPTGLKPKDEEFKKISEYFSEQIRGLKDGGVDIILIETMTIVEEMKIAFEIARNETNLPIAVSMSFKIENGQIYTYAGIDFKNAVKEMINLGADVIGANCGNGFAEMVEIAKFLKSLAGDIPVLIQPSAGTPQKINRSFIYPDTPDKILPYVEKLIDIGVNIIGGCCGTTPEHIKVMRRIIDEKFK